jgi:hypothetical protein
MRSPKPGGGLLYALVPLALVLLVAAHLIAPSDGWRQVAEGVASLLIMGAAALWVRMNRLAIALLGKGPESRESLRAWVAYCPPAVPRRRLEIPGNERTQNLAA